MSSELDWKEVFIGQLARDGFDQEGAQTIYLAEMEARTFFDFDGILPGFFLLQNIERDSSEVRYFWESHSREAVCPCCQILSTTPNNDYYTKAIQDIPSNNRAVYHILRCKKYRCLNPECACQRFIERFDDFLQEKARKTLRFKEYCVQRALGCACNQAEYALRSEGAVISNDTLGRYLKSAAAEKIQATIEQDQVKVLAVDDINLRKGDKTSGCTVLMDQQTHKVLIILRGTTKAVTKRALELFPSSKFFSSDRAGAYSSAGAESGKTLVADRFHLIDNAQEAVKEALMALVPATIFIRHGEGWMQTSSEEPSTSKPRFHVPPERIEEYIELAELTPAKAEKYRNTLSLLELSDQGMKTADIAKKLDLPYKETQALRRTAASTIRSVQDRIKKKIDKQNDTKQNREQRLENPNRKTVGSALVRPARESIVEPYRDTVIDMVKSGGNARVILPVIEGMGYTGSRNAIYQYILKLRKEIPDQLRCDLNEMPPELMLESYPRDRIYSGILKEASKERPDHEEQDDDDTPAKKKPAERRNSPFSEQATELILGPETEPPKKKPQKKTTKNSSRRP